MDGNLIVVLVGLVAAFALGFKMGHQRGYWAFQNNLTKAVGNAVKDRKWSDGPTKKDK